MLRTKKKRKAEISSDAEITWFTVLLRQCQYDNIARFTNFLPFHTRPRDRYYNLENSEFFSSRLQLIDNN